MDEEESRKIGLKYLKTIDGEVGDEVIKALDGVAEDIGNYILEFVFGEIYNRKSLDLKQLSNIDFYLEWRRRRIFEFVKRNDKVTSFLAFHSVFSTVPGVLFVTEFEGNPDEYRASFLTDEYKQIIKEAGHDHIKSGEQGLQTFEYEKVE